MIAVRILVQALTGIVLGGIIGALVTGDWLYTIVWALALPLLLLIAGLAGRRIRSAAPTPSVARVPGIIQRMTGIQVAGSPPVGAVLNPAPTAILSRPTVLNGEPVDAAPRARPAAADRRTVPWWSRALALLAILGAAALTLIPSYRMIGWIVGDLAQGRWDGRDMRTGIHQQEAVDDLFAVIGGTEVTRIGFYDGYVIADAPTAPGADTTDTYTWRYGRAWREGPESIQPSDLEAELFDAGGIDFDLIGELTRASMADAGWPSFDSFLPSVYRDPADPGGGAVIVVHLSSPYYSASYTYSTDGTLLRKEGTGID